MEKRDLQVDYIVTVERVTRGVWAENEYVEVGKKPDGSAEYGSRPVEKMRSRKDELFRTMSRGLPDLLRMARVVDDADQKAVIEELASGSR